ncbi:protein FAM234A [Genypterus blacodes]|uniref:protein FAM234A n=1 Tax=Genypterus blacodes TaxID=154954 RepID=UPI003F774C4A
METTNHANEGDPLKKGEEGAETLTASTQTELKKSDCKEVLCFGKLSHWRTAVFFFSLFLCLTIVFAFSFVIPCPVRPQYLVTWNRTFYHAGTYDFLDFEDANSDKVMDILIVLKDTEGSKNNTCADEGLPSPCVFVLAVDGTHGDILWERPLAPEFKWAQCGFDREADRNWDCLLCHSDQITAIDKLTGVVRWQQPQPPGVNATVPVLSVPDLDGDKVADMALVTQALGKSDTSTRLLFLSGATGLQIGSEVTVDSPEATKHLLHCTKKASCYLLLQKDTGLYGAPLWRIAANAKTGMGDKLKRDKHWESKVNATSGLITVYESDSVKHVVRTKRDLDEPANLVLVTGSEVVMVDGEKLKVVWRVNISSVLSVPSFGYFNKDTVLDVVVEEDIGNNTKRIVILDGTCGDLLWRVDMLASSNSPRPAVVHTTNIFSIFMFWGLLPSEANASVPFTDRRYYMLHPLHYQVLLESTNTMEHIVTFKATLLEHGRHACYILLTGPESQGAEGTVVLRKQKLKEEVPNSRVLLIGADLASDSDEEIKLAFNRLRFSDD